MIAISPKLAPSFRSFSLRLGAMNGTWALVALGVSLRLWHFLRFPSVWHDEAAVLLNAIHLELGQMLGPLLYHEAAPPLFLMAERIIFLICGDSLWAFRLLPLAASCVALVLVALLAQRTLPRTAAVWAIALFATSDRLLYHAIEAKPYSLDVLIAATIAYGYARSWHWPLWRQCLAALPLLPVVLWLSFSACFVVGGWFICQLPALLRSRSRFDWLAALTLAAAVTTSFAVLVLGPAHAQRDASMESCWTSGFPDWQRPWLVPAWFVRSTLDIFSYCISPQGWALAGFIAAGAWRLWRPTADDGPAEPPLRRNLLVLFVAPLALALVAALLGKYPYCGLRVLAFMTPAICVLVAVGIVPLMGWMRSRSRVGVWLLWAALAIPFVHTALRVAVPWARADTAGSARYVLEHWQPGDGIGFNHWEGDYYFRGEAAAWIKAPSEMSPAVRLWYVAVAPEQALREELLQAIPTNWRQVERREFSGATVVLFVRGPVEPTSTSAPPPIP
jgi:hypothetical protein